jgi:hypothetical protein
MAIVGHWASLEEAQKLVQSKLIAGLIQETWMEGGILEKLPITGIDSLSLEYLRETTVPGADFYDIHEQIPWKSGQTYSEKVSVSLKRAARQDIIDHFIAKNWKNPNDYKAMMLSELRKGCVQTINDRLIYGNASSNPKEFTGLYGLVTAAQSIDAGQAALSIYNLRCLVDLVKPRPDFLLMPKVISRRLDMAVTTGISTGGANTNAVQVGVTAGTDRFGARMLFFDGIPIIATDYMGPETNDTGVLFSNVRLKNPAGTNYSIIAVRLGSIEDGGVTLLCGAETGGPDFFRVLELSDLEDYDAGGIRLVAYTSLANGSTKSIAVMHDVTNAAVTA